MSSAADVRSLSPAGDKAGPKPLWLDAWHDPVASLRAFGPCLLAANLAGDGDWRLVVADADMKLKVWQGTHRASEHALQDVPVAVTTFFPDNSLPRVPHLAVAAGAHVYVFRNLRPSSKFSLQGDGGGPGRGAGAPARPSTSSITCMDSIRTALDEPEAPSCLVLGTEDCQLLVLKPDASAVAQAIRLPAPPALLSVAGTLELGHRISVACRDGRLYTVKGGALAPGAIQLEAQVVGLVRLGKKLLVGTMAAAVHCYSGSSGPAAWSLALPAPITAMAQLAMQAARLTKRLLLGLANGEVRVYNDRLLVSVHRLASPAWGLWFGRYGREECSLVTVSRCGALDIKILPRTANLGGGGPGSAAAAAASALGGPEPLPLAVPKKSRLAVDMAQRERDQGPAMHRAFQRDLAKLRLEAARAFVRVLGDGQGAVAQAADAGLCLEAGVQGLGPTFRLALAVRNDGQAALAGVQLALLPEPAAQYRPSARQLRLPLLVPGVDYEYHVGVECLDAWAAPGAVRIVGVVAASGGGAQAPLLAARVQLPACEPDG